MKIFPMLEEHHLQDFLFSFLPVSSICNLKALNKICKQEYEKEHYSRMLTLRILHDLPVGRRPSLRNVTNEEIQGWEVSRLLEELTKQGVRITHFPIPGIRYSIYNFKGAPFKAITLDQLALWPLIEDQPSYLVRALKEIKRDDFGCGLPVFQTSKNRDYPAALLGLANVGNSQGLLWEDASLLAFAIASCDLEEYNWGYDDDKRCSLAMRLEFLIQTILDNEALKSVDDESRNYYNPSLYVDARILLHHIMLCMNSIGSYNAFTGDRSRVGYDYSKIDHIDFDNISNANVDDYFVNPNSSRWSPHFFPDGILFFPLTSSSISTKVGRNLKIDFASLTFSGRDKLLHALLVESFGVADSVVPNSSLPQHDLYNPSKTKQIALDYECRLMRSWNPDHDFRLGENDGDGWYDYSMNSDSNKKTFVCDNDEIDGFLSRMKEDGGTTWEREIFHGSDEESDDESDDENDRYEVWKEPTMSVRFTR